MSVKFIYSPKASPLFIDHISLTCDVAISKQKKVAENFLYYMSEEFGGKLYESKLYKHNKKIYFGGSGWILVQCKPKAVGSNFFRIEWNPSLVDSEYVVMAADMILPGGYSDLIKYSRITRIDITTDVKHLKTSELLFKYPGLSISYNYLKSGMIQTAYLGRPGSESTFRFYDKVQQLKMTNLQKPKQYKIPLPEHNITRIEWEYRPKKNVCTLGNICDLCGPNYQKLWCGIVTCPISKPKNDFESHVNTVLKLSRYEGLIQGLLSIASWRRAEVLKYISDNALSCWWKPSELWKTFPAAIESIVSP